MKLTEARGFESCDDAYNIHAESEKLKRQLRLQQLRFAAKLEKSQDDLQQALCLNAKLQEALASKAFASGK